MKVKAVQLLVNSHLPEELRDYNRKLDAGGISDLLAEVARKYPDEYPRIVKAIADIGRNASYFQGETLTLEDMRPVVDKGAVLAEMDKEVEEARKNAIDDDDFREMRNNIWTAYSAKLEKMTGENALQKGNNLAYSVVSGARGKPQQLQAMLTTPGVYQDSKGEIIPLFVRHSFGEGLRPAEYLASTYGARASVLATKIATAKGGYLAKLMTQAATPLVVSERDCGANNGLDLSIDDTSIRNRVLMRDTLGFPRGTIIDKQVINKLRASKLDHVLVGSALTCQSRHGVCARCIGAQADGKLPSVGDAVGITAAQALGEPICLDENTLVRMADWSAKKIKDIKPGEWVLGADMNGIATPVRVVNVFHNGPRDCVKTIVRKGRGRKSETVELISTREHKVLSSKLRKGFSPKIQPIEKPSNHARHVVYMSKGLERQDIGKEEPWAAILGLLLGDGTYSDANRGVTLSCYEPETLKWAKEELRKFACQLNHAAHGEYHIVMQDQSGARNVLKHPLKKKLIAEQMWESNAFCKKVPSTIAQWDNQSVAKFIGGYIAADGWVTNTGIIGFSSVSKTLTESIKELLEQRFGIYSTRITEKRKKKKDGSTYEPSFECSVACKEDIIHFLKVIPIPGVKQKRLKRIVRSWKPTEYERGRFKVISQESVGVKDTWDLEVDNETHLFVLANSLIVSNTQSALNCLVEGTEVRMADFTIKRIETIEPGEMVMGSDIHGRLFPVTVTAKWNQGIQPVQRYSYRMGQTKQILHLEATEAHPVLSNTKKSSCKEAALNTTLRKLPAGYKARNVAAVLPTSYDDSHLHFEPWAMMAGILLGDGIRCQNTYTPTMSCADPILVEDLNHYLVPLGLRLVKRARSHDWAIVMKEDPLDAYRDSSGKVMSGARNPMKQKIIQWGMLGKYAHEKRVPREAWAKWNNEAVAAMIAGYIATDGSVYKNKDGQIGISFSSCSRGLLEDIKELLMLRLGVPSAAITRIGRGGKGNHVHDQWAFTVTRISEIRKLANLLPVIPGVKGKRFKELVKSANYNRNDEFYRCRRIAVEDLGERQCWDISVDHPDELFVLANGLIVKNTKHTGGQAKGKKEYSGFNVINRFVQSPETFEDRAVVAETDGIVEKIEEAPQGGSYVFVNGEKHYISPNYPIKVKPGEKVEAGDQLAEGLVDPRDIIRLRGIGEGRRYYAERLKRILDDSGMKADPRNTEILARAALDHVVIDDVDGPAGTLPDDVVSYNKILWDYDPPEDTTGDAPERLVNRYLQVPALHYSVGTRITPKIAKHLGSRGFTTVYASETPPPFTPEMVRLQTATHNDPDWLASQNSSYLKAQLQDKAVRGRDTNIEANPHFVPRLAVGQDFGKNVRETGKF